MDESAAGKLLRKFRILVAPLDWGLGHATRCVPIVKELLARDCEVWLAGEGAQEQLLRLEFPDLPFLPLKGYRIAYGKSSRAFRWTILRQVPGIIASIIAEHRWLRKALSVYGFDAVVSDNRFGLFHSKIPSIFITHQLTIKTGLHTWADKILQKFNYRFIRRFSECWIPDLAAENNLAGELSHPLIKPNVTLCYIGLLSRFEKNQLHSRVNEDQQHLLFMLSGPEPQRTILEETIIDDVTHYSQTATIVRGLPGTLSVIPSSTMIKFYNHLPTEELTEEIQKAGCVISRSGYSTVMDLVALKKKSILIPTPGQTEQEYIARHLQEKQIALSIKQQEFSLAVALKQADNFDYKIPTITCEQLQQAIDRLITNLRSR